MMLSIYSLSGDDKSTEPSGCVCLFSRIDCSLVGVAYSVLYDVVCSLPHGYAYSAENLASTHQTYI